MIQFFPKINQIQEIDKIQDIYEINQVNNKIQMEQQKSIKLYINNNNICIENNDNDNYYAELYENNNDDKKMEIPIVDIVGDPVFELVKGPAHKCTRITKQFVLVPQNKSVYQKLNKNGTEYFKISHNISHKKIASDCIMNFVLSGYNNILSAFLHPWKFKMVSQIPYFDYFI